MGVRCTISMSFKPEVIVQLGRGGAPLPPAGCLHNTKLFLVSNIVCTPINFSETTPVYVLPTIWITF
jgi:hypothetical protein